jgi:hypothetical protein
MHRRRTAPTTWESLARTDSGHQAVSGRPGGKGTGISDGARRSFYSTPSLRHQFHANSTQTPRKLNAARLAFNGGGA